MSFSSLLEVGLRPLHIVSPNNSIEYRKIYKFYVPHIIYALNKQRPGSIPSFQSLFLS